MLIAQITDFHVTPPGQLAGAVDTRAAFSALVDRLARVEPRPDLLIVSGDLAEVGVEEEYAFVRAGLERLAIPFLAVPGNHDRRAAMRAAFGAQYENPGAAPDHLAVMRDVGELRIIGLDTLVEGRSHGAIKEEQLAWLATRLDAAEGRPVLVVMHHPPFVTGIPAMDAIGLIEGRAELAALLRGRANILGTLCGHVHRAIAGTFAGHRAFIAPSASHQFALDVAGPGFRVVKEPPQIALHRVVDGALVTCLVPGPTLSW